MKHKQQGVALVVSLVLLVVTLLLGVSSMQASLVDERLAGNYRAATQAQMAAEYGVSKRWTEIVTSPSVRKCKDGWDNYPADGSKESLSGYDGLAFTVEYCREGGSYSIVGNGYAAHGEVKRAIKAVASRVGSGFLGLSPITIPSPLDEFDPASSEKFSVEGELLDDGDRSPAISASREEDKQYMERQLGKDLEKYEDMGGITSPVGESLLNDAALFEQFISMVKDEAWVRPGGRLDSGGYGTREEPKLIYIDESVEGNTGNFSGAGVMIIDGDASFNGTPSFDGLLIVLGDYKVSGGGNGGVNGTVIVAPYERKGDDWKYEHVDLEFGGGGNANYKYDDEALSKAFELLGEAGRFWNSNNISQVKPGEPILSDWKG